MRRCKLCGGRAEIIDSKDNVLVTRYVSGFRVICSNLGCKNTTKWYGSEAQAISAWQETNKVNKNEEVCKS